MFGLVWASNISERSGMRLGLARGRLTPIVTVFGLDCQLECQTTDTRPDSDGH